MICAFHGTGSNHIHARVLLPCCQTHGLCPGFTKLYTRCVTCQTEAQAHHCKKRSTSCHRMHEVTLRCAMRRQLVESTHTACSTGVAAAMELGCPYCVTPSPLSPHTLGGRRCHCREAATRPRRERHFHFRAWQALSEQPSSLRHLSRLLAAPSPLHLYHVSFHARSSTTVCCTVLQQCVECVHSHQL